MNLKRNHCHFKGKQVKYDIWSTIKIKGFSVNHQMNNFFTIKQETDIITLSHFIIGLNKLN